MEKGGDKMIQIRQSQWKRIICMFLAVLMMVSVTACGKGGGDSETVNANSALAKENVYSYDKIEIDGFGDSYSVYGMEYKGGRIWMLAETWDYNPQARTASVEGAVTEETAEEVSADVDNDMSLEEEEDIDPGFGVMPETEGASTEAKLVISFLPDGSDLQQFALKHNISEGAVYSYINMPSFGTDRVYAMKVEEFMDESDPENVIYKSNQYVTCWDLNGEELWSTDLTEAMTGEAYQGWIRNMKVLDDGSICAICSIDEQNKMVMLDKDGNITGEKLIEISTGYLSDLFIRPDGSLLAVTTNENWDTYYGSIYDVKTGTMGEAFEFPDMLVMNGYMQGTVSDFVLSNSQGIYTYNLGDEDITLVMDYVNSDFDGSWLNHMVMTDEKQIVAVYNDFIDYRLNLAVMNYVAPEDVPDKKVLVMGANYVDTNVRKRIVDFNKTNPGYRITLKDYSLYQTTEDWMAGYTQLNNDIITGKMPDILVVDGQMKIDNYVAKGLLADIGEMIANDPELSETEYVQSVFDAYSIDGILYSVIPEFAVQTMIGKSSVVGDNNGWNMDEFMALAETLEEPGAMFGQLTRNEFMSQILRYCGSDFIDLATGKCSFDSPEFIKMLEFAKLLPETVEYSEDFWMNYESMYRDNRAYLMTLYISDFRSLNAMTNGYFGEEVSYVGFPNEDRNGSVISTDTTFVISEASKDKDGAWEFVRYYLTEEYQRDENRSYMLPVMKSVFMEKAAQATEKYYWIDENGNKIEEDEQFYINGEVIVLEPMSQEQIDGIVAFIESVNRPAYSDTEIINIINEEAAPFLAGQKSAEEVAQIIQNRAQVYVNDKR